MTPQSQRKRLFFGLAIVLAWFGFVIEGSHALFADSAALTGNTLSTGSTDLQVSNSQSASSTTFADSRPGFVMALNPGQSDEHYFLLKNSGASDIPLAIDMATTNPTVPDAMATAVTLTVTPVDSAGVATGDAVTNTVEAWINRPQSLKTTIARGQAQRYKVTTTLSAGYNLENTSFGYDFIFNGVQVLSA